MPGAEIHLLHGVERLLGAVALRLLHLDGLRGGLRLDAVEVQLPRQDLLEALGRLHELGIAEQLHVASDLRDKGVQSAGWRDSGLEGA